MHQAIGHLSGACFFDLSPRTTDGTYPGKAVAMLLHLVFKVGGCLFLCGMPRIRVSDFTAHGHRQSAGLTPKTLDPETHCCCLRSGGQDDGAVCDLHQRGGKGVCERQEAGARVWGTGEHRTGGFNVIKQQSHACP
jgi:hypothetical protein